MFTWRYIQNNKKGFLMYYSEESKEIVLNFSLAVKICAISSIVFNTIKIIKSLYYYCLNKEIEKAKYIFKYFSFVFNLIMSLELILISLEIVIAFSFIAYACFGEFDKYYLENLCDDNIVIGTENKEDE